MEKSLLKEIIYTSYNRANVNLVDSLPFFFKRVNRFDWKTGSSRMDCDARVYNRSGPAGVCERVALSFRFPYVLRMSDET